MAVGVSQEEWRGLNEAKDELENRLGATIKLQPINPNELVATETMPWDLISMDNDTLGSLVQKGLVKELPQDSFSSPDS
jgi:hypothetical protein